MSTGMAGLEKIKAVQTARQAGATQIALLKCTSAYPAAPEEMNLRTIPELSGVSMCAAGSPITPWESQCRLPQLRSARALLKNACALSRASKGPNGAFSLEPGESPPWSKRFAWPSWPLGRCTSGLVAGSEEPRFSPLSFRGSRCGTRSGFYVCQCAFHTSLARPAHALFSGSPRQAGYAQDRTWHSA